MLYCRYRIKSDATVFGKITHFMEGKMKRMLKILVVLSLTVMLLMNMASCKSVLDKTPYLEGPTNGSEVTTDLGDQTKPEDPPKVTDEPVTDPIKDPTTEPVTDPTTDPTTGSNPVDPDQPEPHEHSYKAVVTDPTCEAAGYTTYTCSCGHSYIEDGEASLGHIDANADHKCDRNCGKTDMGTCEDADKDHNCDYGCDKTFGDCVDADKDHDCD